jgi:hypothetical protein
MPDYDTDKRPIALGASPPLVRPSGREGGRTRPYGSAILSLLVAADQRCPAIIGQAHLLYYARFGTTPENVERTFAQLKRDADDLCKAIADVDAAMKETRPESE